MRGRQQEPRRILPDARPRILGNRYRQRKRGCGQRGEGERPADPAARRTPPPVPDAGAPRPGRACCRNVIAGRRQEVL